MESGVDSIVAKQTTKSTLIYDIIKVKYLVCQQKKTTIYRVSELNHERIETPAGLHVTGRDLRKNFLNQWC